MPVFKLTIKQNMNSNGVRLDKGMSVQIQSTSPSTTSPFSNINDKEKIAQAFMNMWGVDVKKACAVDNVHMSFEKI